MKNNLFQWATKELSQDAFICWLMSYSMENAKEDAVLKGCSQAFLREFLYNEDISGDIVVNNIERQCNHIDVLLTVNNKYKIIVEDKTYSKEHSDQLMRYLDVVENDFADYIPVGVFYKTGFQSDYSQVNSSGYRIVGRDTIVRILTEYAGQSNNQILKDYFEYYNHFEEEAQSYQKKPLIDWDWWQINAFYDGLQKAKVTDQYGLSSNYGKVNNAVGGFYAMWIFNDKRYFIEGAKCELYLQLEHVNGILRYCLKVSIEEKPKDLTYKAIRDAIIWLEDSNGNWSERTSDNNFIRPDRYGSGKTMTVRIFKEQPKTYEEAIDVLHRAIDKFIAFTSEFAELKINVN